MVSRRHLLLVIACAMHCTCYRLPQTRVGSSRAPLRASSPVADELHGWDASQAAAFLEKYWQKRPVLIRQAFPAIETDLRQLTEADFFALCMDEDVESRTLVRNGDAEDGWTKEYGPFSARDVKKLATSPRDWTVLVQEVDRHIPSIADLWHKCARMMICVTKEPPPPLTSMHTDRCRYFDFIPAWRRDDIMVSYAAPGGGIGAHVDR